MSLDELTDTDKLVAVQRFVRIFRAQRNEKITPGYKPELSCIMHGEGANLLYRQLITTTENTGDWSSLNNPEILNLVYQQVLNDSYCIEKKFIESHGYQWQDWMDK